MESVLLGLYTDWLFFLRCRSEGERERELRESRHGVPGRRNGSGGCSGPRRQDSPYGSFPPIKVLQFAHTHSKRTHARARAHTHTHTQVPEPARAARLAPRRPLRRRRPIRVGALVHHPRQPCRENPWRGLLTSLCLTQRLLTSLCLTQRLLCVTHRGVSRASSRCHSHSLTHTLPSPSLSSLLSPLSSLSLLSHSLSFGNCDV